MELNDRKAFIETVIGFAELKGKVLSAPALELYWEAMKSWPLVDFKAAAQYLLKTCEFMPTPKNFEDLRKAGNTTSGEAWALVLQHCKGAYRDGSGIDNGGPIDTAVDSLGGYRAVAFHDIEFLPVIGRRFESLYAETQDKMDARQALISNPKNKALGHG